MNIKTGGAALLLIVSSGLAQAEVRISESTSTYAISGSTGQALVAAMKSSGPRGGLNARAIASTSYTFGYNLDIARANAGCQVKDVSVRLNIKTLYPEVRERVGPELAGRWSTSIAAIQVHERKHASLAREMAGKVADELTGMTADNCEALNIKAKKRAQSIYTAYDIYQYNFDRAEHKDGGNIPGLLALLRGRSQ